MSECPSCKAAAPAPSQGCAVSLPMRIDEELAKALYYAFVVGVGGVNHDGRPYGTWEEVRLNPRSDAWFTVARRARELLQCQTWPENRSGR
jgi:hypothetical protein